jgi:hypothetical protein
VFVFGSHRSAFFVEGDILKLQFVQSEEARACPALSGMTSWSSIQAKK